VASNLDALIGGAGKALASRNYRIYWSGGVFSILGFWMHKLALSVLVWEITHSLLWLGVIGFVALFPAFILSPFSGAVGDRFGMRKTAMIALTIAGTSAAVLGIVVLMDKHNVWIVLVLTTIQGLAFAFDLPARQGLVPLLVERPVLSAAIAVNTTTFHLGATVGPGLFFLFASYLDLEWAFLLNAASFFYFGHCLNALDLPPRPVKDLTGTTLLTDMRDGLIYAWTHPGIRALFLMAIIPHLLVRPFTDLLPGYSELIFHRGADGVAIMAASFGLGSFLFGLWLARRGRMSGLSRFNVVSIFFCTILMFGFAVTGNFWFAVGCLFGAGVCIIAFAVANQSLVQNAVDPTKRARVISLSTGLAVGLPAIGALGIGALLEVFGPQAPLAGAMILGLIVWFWTSRGILRNAEDLEKER